MAKKVNNPNGKKGSEEHQKAVNEQIVIAENEFSDIQKSVVIETEVAVSTPQGKKKFRIADLAVYRMLNNILVFLKIVQVGKTDANGNPVKREQEAINDIEAHTNIKVNFIDYRSKK